jgi:hypothetical protein
MYLQQVQMMSYKYLNTINYFLIFALFMSIMSCEQSAYEKMLHEEYNKEHRVDSLFLGFYLGKTREDFFKHGWEMNKQGLIMQGPENMNVAYYLESEEGDKDIEMLFYPDFDESLKIKSMPMRFRYKGWAPWNRELFSDSLLIAIKDTLMHWYGGNEFVLFERPKDSILFWYKIDGNRQITLAPTDEREVKAVIKDLFHPDNDPFKK